MGKADLIELEGNDEGQNQTDRRAQKEVDESIGKHFPEHWIVDQPDIIIEPGPGSRAQKVPFLERQNEGVEGRVKPDDQKKHDRHGQKGPGPDRPFLHDREVLIALHQRLSLVSNRGKKAALAGFTEPPKLWKVLLVLVGRPNPGHLLEMTRAGKELRTS